MPRRLRLRAIARAGTGVDNVDVDAASARGIVVMNAPGANSISVAELTMAQLLALARKISAADASMKQGRWDKKKFLGEEVRGKTLGLAGLGRIGQEVARRAPRVRDDGHRARSVHRGRSRATRRRLVSLDEVCARADFLRSTCRRRRRHGTSSTRSAWRGPKGLRIINTARGDLIDEDGAGRRHRGGHIGGAALDVFANEPTEDHSCSSCRKSSRCRTSRPRPARARNWSVWKRRPRFVTSSRPA